MRMHGLLRATALAAAICVEAVPAALHAGGGGGGGGGRGGGGGGGGGRGGGGGFSGGGRGGGFYGGYGRGGGYGGYGRGGYGYGYGRGFYGYGGGFYGLYPFGFAPYYGSDYGFDYPNDYPYGGAYDTPALFAGGGRPPTDTRSFYPPDVETAPSPGESNRALVAVHVPADAVLLFQGHADAADRPGARLPLAATDAGQDLPVTTSRPAGPRTASRWRKTAPSPSRPGSGQPTSI